MLSLGYALKKPCAGQVGGPGGAFKHTPGKANGAGMVKKLKGYLPGPMTPSSSTQETSAIRQGGEAPPQKASSVAECLHSSVGVYGGGARLQGIPEDDAASCMSGARSRMGKSRSQSVPQLAHNGTDFENVRPTSRGLAAWRPA
eukprot:TRINITY_DN12812_c0_g1_i1.p2 TRINITY_DN12812_c0_g1~~TRINITY_DN12812_c0_g1_i1.p2  ORF type:complete len:144 (+),score=23.12 TRINITY_DN12812_c0_g1_i1:84-515(+)